MSTPTLHTAAGAHAVANTIAIGPSRWMAWWIIMAGAGASTLAVIYLPWLAALAVAAAALGFGWRALRLHAWQTGAQAVVALRPDADGLAIALKDGTWISGSVLAGGLVSRWLTVLRVRQIDPPRKTHALVLLPDRLHAEDYRRLRVYLNWGLARASDKDAA